MQLYLDCDGVLADFDRAATELLGMPPRVYEKRRRQAALDRERRKLEDEQARELPALERRLESARGRYDRAMRVWRAEG